MMGGYKPPYDGGGSQYRPPEYGSYNPKSGYNRIPPESVYKDNGELRIMTLKFYFECRGIKWHGTIPASVRLAYKDKGIKL